MNLNEALGRISDPEAKAFFEKMVKDQNAYITKLESQLKDASQAGPSARETDDVTMKYLEKNMRRDVIADAKAKILTTIQPDIFAAVEQDWLGFLEKSMDKAHTTEEFAVDAFNLVLGRCYANKEHAIHSVGKGAPNPGATPAAQAGTNGQAIAGVQSILTPQPPVMTGKDIPAATGAPVNGQQLRSTKDAFSALKAKLGQAGGSKFQ